VANEKQRGPTIEPFRAEHAEQDDKHGGNPYQAYVHLRKRG
jgi:hypothetical protein